MPVVPKVTEPSVVAQGLPAAFQTVRATESNQGAAVGQAVGGIGDLLFEQGVARQEELTQIKTKQDNRRDAVNRAKTVKARIDANNALIADTNEKFDFSEESVLGDFGKGINKSSLEALNSHAASGASEESIALLEVMLLDADAKATGTASGIARKIGQANLDAVHDTNMTDVGDMASSAPTIENLTNIIGNEIPDLMRRIVGGEGQENEIIKEKALAEQAVLSAVDQLIATGRAEQAESLLLDGDMGRHLTAKAQRGTKRKIAIALFNSEKEARTAESPIGQIRADEANGLISKEDADAAVKKAVFIAREKLNIPGQIVAATDLNPDLPDDFNDVFLITQPNGSLSVIKGVNGAGGKITFSQQEQSDGTMVVYQQVGNNPPEFVDLLRDENNEPIKTGVSARGEAIGGRATVTAEQRDRSIDISENRLEQTITQNARTSEAALRADFEKRAEPFREQLRAVNQLEIVLAGEITGLDNKVITNLVSRAIAPTNVRAQAELDSFKGFGDLVDRVSGAVSTFFTGVRTEAQLDQVRTLVAEMREKHIGAAMDELETGFTNVATRSGLDPKNVVVSGVVKVKTLEEALKLPEGTKFIDPSGVLRIR